MAVLSWMGAGILTINAVSVNAAGAESQANGAGPGQPTKELSVQLPVERGKGHVVEVDHAAPGQAHHPLYLYADSLDVNGTPLVAALTPKVPGSSKYGQLYGRYEVRFHTDSLAPGYKLAWMLWVSKSQ